MEHFCKRRKKSNDNSKNKQTESKKNLTSYIGGQISLNDNLSLSNDTFAFDNSLCGSNDDLQPTISTQHIKPLSIPPRALRTLNGNNKSSSFS
jgi:hypothetical protein